jgi:uncharacterized peroxidase-related enzyme
MAHIQLQEGLPGIVGALTFSPETAKPLLQLAELLLRGPNTLTSAEREMIAAHVSYRNECDFCQLSHSAAAAAHLGGNYDLIDSVKVNPEAAEVSNKLKALLNIAGKVQKGGKHVTSQDVTRARMNGATDKENSRHRADRRCFLHVQPVCGWPGNSAAAWARGLSRNGRTDGPRRLRPPAVSFSGSGLRNRDSLWLTLN